MPSIQTGGFKQKYNLFIEGNIYGGQGNCSNIITLKANEDIAHPGILVIRDGESGVKNLKVGVLPNKESLYIAIRTLDSIHTSGYKKVNEEVSLLNMGYIAVKVYEDISVGDEVIVDLTTGEFGKVAGVNKVKVNGCKWHRSSYQQVAILEVNWLGSQNIGENI